MGVQGTGGRGEECSLGEAQGLISDTDTAVLILDTYLVTWGQERSSSRARERLAAMRLVLYSTGSRFSVVLVLTGWCARRPSGRCAGSGPETAASACSSSLVLWVGAFPSHLGRRRNGRRNVSPLVYSAATNICSGYPTFKTCTNASSVPIKKLNLLEHNIRKKGEQCVATY